MFPATLTAACDNGTFYLTYHDADEEEGVHAAHLRRLFTEGDVIEARFQGGDMWYPGRIQSIDETTVLYSANYDDEDFETGLDVTSMLRFPTALKEEIEPQGSCSTAPVEASQEEEQPLVRQPTPIPITPVQRQRAEENKARARDRKRLSALMHHRFGRRGIGREDGDDVSFVDTEQQVIQRAEAGGNIFITGFAGTGKSEVTREIIRRLELQGNRVAVAASTGTAAVNLGGNAQTLHSPSKVSIPRCSKDFGNMWSNSRQTWENICALVVNECGFVIAEFTGWLDATVRKI